MRVGEVALGESEGLSSAHGMRTKQPVRQDLNEVERSLGVLEVYLLLSPLVVGQIFVA